MTTPTPEERLIIRVERQEATAFIAIDGDLDPHTSPYFTDMVQQSLDDDEVTKVAVGVESLNFTDATGLRAILSTKRYADTLSKEFELWHPNRSLGKLLDVTGLADFIPVIE